jgi:putative endonuclease
MKTYYTYIMSNPRRTVLYVGMTNDIGRRVGEHKSHANPGFTATYNCTDLLYFEESPDVTAVIAREKQLKGWSRNKKLSLIRTQNPGLADLSNLSS